MKKRYQDVSLRCEDHAETVVFSKHTWNYEDNNCYDVDYEFTIEDSYCGGDYMGLKGRFKRAWNAFFAKPIYYTGIYCENKERVKKFLKDCLDLIENDTEE